MAHFSVTFNGSLLFLSKDGISIELEQDEIEMMCEQMGLNWKDSWGAKLDDNSDN